MSEVFLPPPPPSPSHNFTSFVLALLLFLLTLLLALQRFLPSSSALKRRPPAPPTLPLIGNLHQIGTYAHRSLHSLSKRYGPLMLLHFGSTPVLVVSSAEFAHEVMKTHDLALSDRPRSSIGERLLYYGRDVSMAPYSEYWRQLRSICVLRLLSRHRVQSFRRVREEEISLMINELRQLRRRGTTVDLSETFARLTNDIICRVALGRKYSDGERGTKFQELLKEFVGLLGIFYVGDYIPSLGWVNKVMGVDGKVERVAREFDEFLDEVVEEHRQKTSFGREDDKDFVDVLLDIQKDGSLGFQLEPDSVKAIILDMFAAGTDTTYTVLEWAMTRLFQHPAAMEQLKSEVRLVPTADKGLIAEEDLENMPFLKAVIKETLRLHPPIPLLVPRSATKDVNIKGYDIDAGTMVVTNAWTIGRDPAIWDDPEDFRPERFLQSSVDYMGQDFELIPFGAGRRGCPGTVFAMATNEAVLGNLIRSFEWEMPEGVRAEDIDMSECAGLTSHRKVHLQAVPSPFSA